MKELHKIYLVIVNNEPIFSSLDENTAKYRFLEETEQRVAGFIKSKRDISIREVNIKVDKK